MRVDSLEFSFNETVLEARKFDDLSFYKKTNSHFQLPCECVQCPSHDCQGVTCEGYDTCTRRKKNEGLKGVDVVLYTQQQQLFLIESKDYRQNPNPPIDHIVAEVAKKFRDTLFLLWCASLYADDRNERKLADKWRRNRLHVSFVFNYESPVPAYPSGLHNAQRGVVSSLTIRKKLQEVFKEVCDASAIIVTNMSWLQEHHEIYPWSIAEAAFDHANS